VKAQWWNAHAGYLKPADVDDDAELIADIGIEASEDAVSADVVRITRELWADQGKARQSRQRTCTEVYYGCDWSGDDEGADRDALAGVGITATPSGYNVIQSITDTSVSRLVQNRIRPLILTENGNAEQQQQAQSLQKVVEGTFWDAKVYGELGEHVCFDGHLFDAGGVKVYPDYAGKRLVLDRIDPSRFMVSVRESRLGNPRSGYYYDSIDRSELLAMFRDAKPEVLQAIRDAKCAPQELNYGKEEEFVDDVEIFEAWHLPSSSVDRTDPTAWGLNEDGEYDPKLNPGHDGRRVLCIDGTVLIEEPWPFPYFPIAWFKPMRKRRSYWSRSVPEVLAGAQLLLNNMNARVDEIMHFHGRPLLAVWKNAKLNTAKITNGTHTILETMVPPSQAILHIVPQSVPGEYLARIDKIIAWSEKQWGINEMALTGQKPAGIDHAPGMQHLSDELSARHTTKMHAWESFHTDLAQLVIDGHRMLDQHCDRMGEKYTVVFGGDRELEAIDFRKADLGGSAVYRVKCWPTNLLPQTPAAKANKLIEWMQAGFITAEQALTMVDHPDTESLVGDHVAKRKNIEKKLDALIAGESFENCMAHPYMDLALAKQICSNRLNKFEADGYPDKTLDKLRQWFEACQGLIDAEAKKQAALAAPPPMPTGVPPMPMPPGGAPAPMAPPPGPPMPPAPPMAA
jgi:hypothetical protein